MTAIATAQDNEAAIGAQASGVPLSHADGRAAIAHVLR